MAAPLAALTGGHIGAETMRNELVSLGATRVRHASCTDCSIDSLRAV